MKKFIFTIIVLLGMLTPTSALAQEGAYNEAYGVLVQTYSDDGSTLVDSYLTMYYDNKKKEHTEGIALGLDEMLQDPNMMQARRTLHSVIFDQSFAACDTIKSTKGWFAYCMELKTISGLEYLNTSEVTDMDIMFMECSSLESLDLSHFNTSKVTTMSNMFFFCENLKTLDLSSFNTENVTDMSYMFGNCMGLTTIYVGSYWSTASVTESDGMFSGCSSLVGGAGTTFSEDHTDKAYAHIDRADQPGYFTYGQSGVKGEAEPYAVLSEDKSTLTFYYDDQKTARNGMDVGPFPSTAQYPEWYNSSEQITKVVFDASFANCTTLTSTAFWFSGCTKISEIIDINNLKTDNVTDMNSMFYYCSSLTNLDLSGFKTGNVTDMSYMFANCNSLTSLDLRGFNTENVIAMREMFAYDDKLTSIDLSSFNTEKVDNIHWMFYGCSSLESLDLSSFNTENVTSMELLFYGCSALTSLNLRNLSNTHVTSMQQMFEGCTSLKDLDLSGFKTDNVTNMIEMFHDCSALTNLDLSGFKTDNVTYMSFLFYGCTNLKELNLSGLNTENVTEMGSMFRGCSALSTLDLSGFKTGNVTDMSYMFGNCTNLKELNLSEFNTGNVTDMSYMFADCTNLKELNLSEFNTENVTNMSYMFAGCSSFTNLDLSGFKTDNVFEMSSMFERCTSLETIDVSMFNTANVEYMSNMFGSCNSLTSLDLSNFKADKMRKISFLFYRCSALSTLDLSGFNLANVEDMYAMFNGCTSLKTIYASDIWSCPYVRELFVDCKSLVGGAGTKYDENHTDSDYAHIDGGESNPGYFTDVADKGKEKKEQVATPTWEFQGDLLALSTKTADATIYYAMANWDDESKTDSIAKALEVSTSSSVYSKPIEVTDNIVIKMMATKDGMENSKDTTFIFAYKLWEKLHDVIGYGVDIMYKATDNPKVEQSLVEELRWALNEGDHMYQMRAEVSSREAEYFIITIEELCGKIVEQMEPDEQGGRASFYENVLTVEGDVSFTEALEKVGGLAIVNKSIAAIVWNSTKALTADSLQLIDNPNLLIYVQADSLAPAATKNLIVAGKAKSITLVDTDSINNNFYAPQEFTAESISYTREFKQTTQKDVSRGWEGICLPFTVQSYTHESHGAIAPFRNDNSEFHFWLHQMTEQGMATATNIEANMPYIISMPNNTSYPATYNQAGKVTFSAKNAVVPVSVPSMIHLADGSIGIAGVYNSLSKMEGFYALNVGDDMDEYPEGSVFVNNYRTIRPFEVYSSHADRSAGTRSIISVASLFTGGVDGATGILDATDKQDSDEVKVYSVNGILLKKGKRNEVMNSLPKGLYIIGNQKIMVK